MPETAPTRETDLPRDHGGGIDSAASLYGGARSEWIDLSTGINPVPYPVGDISTDAWAALPDHAAMSRLETAARRFWNVPDAAQVVAANGASALIAQMPMLADGHAAHIPSPTYNEHAAAFQAHHQFAYTDGEEAQVRVYVHPNNPDGRMVDAQQIGGRFLTVIDESFCDTSPDDSHMDLADNQGVLILKSFGKFWGLAGLRLGFAIGLPATMAPGLWVKQPFQKKNWVPDPSLVDLLGPWPVSGPALEIGARALEDTAWATATRARLVDDAAQLDALMAPHGTLVGGTPLFRLYDVGNAATFQDRLAQHHIWSRIFPYSKRWVRLGLPAPDGWDRVRAALA